MKLDKFSIIGLVVALAMLVFQMQYNSKNKEELAQQEAEATESVQTPTQIAAAAKEAELALSAPQVADTFQEEIVELKTDLATFQFSTVTGGVTRAIFPEQHEVNQLEVPVALNRFGTKSIGGIETASGKVLDAGYKLTNQTDTSLTFIGKLTTGAIAQKEWSLVPSDSVGAAYRLDYKLTIENPTANTIEASSYNLFVGGAAPLYKGELPDQSGFYFLGNKGFKKKKSNPKFKKSFFGSEVSTIEDTVEELGFAGVCNQFFTCFFTPQEEYTARYAARAKEVAIAEEAGGGVKNEVSVAISLPSELIEGNNGREQFDFQLYAGPKHYQTLKKIDSKAGLVMGYGFFRPISGLLNNILTFLHHKIFSNFAGAAAWGLSIIALTIVIRGIMWPLHNISSRSTKRMAKLQPEIAKLKEKYGNDAQRMQQEQMKLFSEYGVNPMGGCLPMLGQIPIFFGLFTMLKSAVEFRHEGFLWIEDLSQSDTLFTIPLFGLDLPVNILPVLMFVSMFIQMRMNPAPTDPTQKMIMNVMPVMMVVFCYNFASALALYWTTSNVFTIFQTWLMKKLPEPQVKKRNGAKKGGFMEKLQKQAEELQKMKEAQEAAKRGGGMRDAKPKNKKPRGPRTGG